VQSHAIGAWFAPALLVPRALGGACLALLAVGREAIDWIFTAARIVVVPRGTVRSHAVGAWFATELLVPRALGRVRLALCAVGREAVD